MESTSDMPTPHTRSMQDDQLQVVIDTIPTMAWSLRPNGALDFVNKRWLDYTGLSFEQALDEPSSVVHPDDLPRVLQSWSSALAAGDSYEDEIRLRGADGQYRWFLVRTVPLRDKLAKIIKWYGTSTDIENRKDAEVSLRSSAVQLQALSRQLVDVQEEERRGLSRELHDRIGQGLTALSLSLRLLGLALPEGSSPDLYTRIADSETLIASLHVQVRELMTELRPPMLDDYGLIPALDWHAKQFMMRTGIPVVVRVPELYDRPSLDIEVALFRIAQEALNNVAKHANATSVEIRVERAGADYVMSIQDDGIGFSGGAERPRRNPGLGTISMRERAEAVSGRFEVRTERHKGTCIVVTVPMKRCSRQRTCRLHASMANDRRCFVECEDAGIEAVTRGSS